MGEKERRNGSAWGKSPNDKRERDDLYQLSSGSFSSLNFAYSLAAKATRKSLTLPFCLSSAPSSVASFQMKCLDCMSTARTWRISSGLSFSVRKSSERDCDVCSLSLRYR